jgi:hypothetical protein
MSNQTPHHNFYKPAEDETGWGRKKNADWDDLDARVPWELATGTITASGGSTPAVETTVQGVASDQLQLFDVMLGVAADPAFDADYAFNYDLSRQWDDTNSEWNLSITVNWDTDPGSGNDVTLRYSVQERDL